ncbi:MAG: hypothetical protein FJ088_04595 [Deltaproteobacteria bacterium]|nr:hypothetical protein [Deltaproteobacteria bacterium]
MRKIKTTYPSFPDVEFNEPMAPSAGVTWQVLCGDRGHWRCGIYSPAQASLDEIKELERHDCPELFLLIRGRLILVITENGAIREIEIEPGKPVLVTAPHSGYCPDGAHTGAAFVVERDEFETEYRRIGELAS